MPHPTTEAHISGPSTAAPPGDSAARPLSDHQRHIVRAAAAAFGVPLAAFVERVAGMLPGVSGLDDLDQAGFDIMVNVAVAAGFRHPAVPLVSAAQLACLDAGRRQLGLSRRVYAQAVRHGTGGLSHRRMTGRHIIVLMNVLEQHGADLWLPVPGFVDRARASTLRRTAWRNGVGEAELRELLMLFGGCTRMRGLDASAYGRVLAALHLRGLPTPAPAPRVAGEPGMATQAQVNVLWRAWHDARDPHDVSEASLDLAIELLLHFPGGVATLTRDGAAEVTAWFVASLQRRVDFRSGWPTARVHKSGTGLPS